MAGFDFGCTIDGTCKTGGNVDIVSNGNAVQQMQHFVNDDGLNAFRLPVGWQYLVNNQLGGPLDATNTAAYDKLVQGCLSSGAAMCIVDVHNYARYNGQIIGQGGPTNDQYASLWSQLATKYAAEPNVAFDIMNEPHDLGVPTWAVSAQAAVTAIRQAGATSQTILLPGTDFASAASFVSSGSAQALSAITNPDGSTTGLVYNVHKYLDSDGSGTHASCVTNNINTAFAPLAQYLRQNNRVAMLTETGGGPTDASCMQMLCQQMDFIK
jgi:endoglucanase